MRAKIAGLSLAVMLSATAGWAQEIRTAPKVITAPDYNMNNCSGFVTDQKVPDEFRLVSGEQSNHKLARRHGAYVNINRGEDRGVGVGDRLFVVRPDDYVGDWPSFTCQEK